MSSEAPGHKTGEKQCFYIPAATALTPQTLTEILCHTHTQGVKGNIHKDQVKEIRGRVSCIEGLCMALHYNNRQPKITNTQVFPVPLISDSV